MKIDEGVFFRGQHYSVAGEYVDGRIIYHPKEPDPESGIAWYSTTADANFVCTEMAESIQIVDFMGALSLAEYLERMAVEQYEQRRKSA